MPMRRLGVSIALTITAALLVGVPLAGPVAATPGCLSEAPVFLAKVECDDEVPPETALTGASTLPNAAGWLATGTMSFAFTGAHTDADADAIVLECKLDGPTQAHDWTGCTSPRTYEGLADSDVTPYTFQVRAVDTADRGYRPSPFSPTPEVVEDLDASPASLTWGQDTLAPVAFVNPDLYDEETPQQPVVVARSVDKAGTPSAWSEVSEFSVPTDLRARRGWKTVKKSGAFDETLVKSKTLGARLVLPKQQVGELRLYAPTAPAYGKVRVKVGATNWRVVNLAGPRAAQREFVVLTRYQGSRTGKVIIEVLTRNKPVFLDAIVARTHNFQG